MVFETVREKYNGTFIKTYRSFIKYKVLVLLMMGKVSTSWVERYKIILSIISALEAVEIGSTIWMWRAYEYFTTYLLSKVTFYYSIFSKT